jgi:hypothetical protein
MHFHLPKPMHGWREFVGEVGIIVIGVLIALGAEQVVESIHWRHEVEAERVSLLQEAKDSADGIAAREEQQGCIDRRLQEIRTVLERHHRGEPLGLIGKIGRPTGQGATRGSWQIALAGQSLSHMSNKEKLAYSGAFGNFDLWDKVRTDEAGAWRRMALLDTADLLSEEDWSGIRSAYSDAVLVNEHMRVLAPWMRQQVARSLPEIRQFRETGDLSAFGKLTAQI